MAKIFLNGQTETRTSSVKGRCLNTGRTHFKKGMTPWNKGLSFKYQPRPSLRGHVPWNKGKVGVMPVAWNKGLHIYMGGKRFEKGQIAPNKGKKLLSITGKNHWNWQGGKTPQVMKIRNSIEHKEWAKAIKERDDFECQICGIRGGILRSNHIKRFADYPELRFELINGITICRNCDIRWVQQHEEDWESYFNFNLMTRRII